MNQYNNLRITLLFIFIVLASLTLRSQNFQFRWNITGIHETYNVKFIRNDSTQFMQVTIDNINGITSENTSVISDSDCDSLFSFCKEYDYRYDVADKSEPVKTYYDTVMSNDKKYIIIEGKQIRPELMDGFGYWLDSVSHRFYKINAYKKITYTDGYYFSGSFEYNSEKKKYKVFIAYINENDKELNSLIYYLIKKYDKKVNLGKLESLINPKSVKVK